MMSIERVSELHPCSSKKGYFRLFQLNIISSDIPLLLCVLKWSVALKSLHRKVNWLNKILHLTNLHIFSIAGLIKKLMCCS